jgi:hypothetical protein
MSDMTLYFTKRFEKRVHSFLLALKVLTEGSLDPAIFVCKNVTMQDNDCPVVEGSGSSGSSGTSTQGSSGGSSPGSGVSPSSGGAGPGPSPGVITVHPRRALVSVASAQDLATYITLEQETGLYRAHEVALLFPTAGMMERFFEQILVDVRENAKLQRMNITDFEAVDLSDGDSTTLNFWLR